MSAYTNTFTLNATRTITLSSATTISFGASTTFAGTGTISLQTVNQTISSATTSRIPNLTIIGGTKTLTNNLYITNFTYAVASSPQILGSGFKVFVNGNFGGSGFSSLGTGVDLVLDGTGTVNYPFITCNGTERIIINTSGTLTFNTTNGITFLDGGRIEYVSGTLVTPSLRWGTQGSATLTVLTSGATWDSFVCWDIGNASTLSLSLLQNFNTQLFQYASDRGSSIETFQVTTTNASRLNVTDRMILQPNTALVSGTFRLNTTGSHYIDKLFILSGSVSRYTFRSTTNGTKATLQLGDKNNSPIFYVDFTDINASSGQEIRTYGGTVSNSNNITSYTSTIFTTGGGGGSFTFVN